MTREIIVSRINAQKSSVATFGLQGPQGYQGHQGVEGGFGASTLYYLFSTSTTNADPGIGKLKFNNANVTLATALYIDDQDQFSTDVQTFLRTIDDSTSPLKGHFKISNRLNPSDFAIFTISSITENTGYFTVSCAYVTGASTSFSADENVTITFARTGDIGPQGSPGPQGFQGPSANYYIQTSAPTSPSNGWAWFNPNDDNLDFYYGASTGWQGAWNEPWGVVGYATTQSNSSTTTGAIDWSGLTVTWNALTNRLYRMTASGMLSTENTGGSDYVDLVITTHAGTNTGTQLAGFRQLVPAKFSTINAYSGAQVQHIETGLSGSVRRKVQVRLGTGTGPVFGHASSIFQASFVIEDIGPAGAPPAS